MCWLGCDVCGVDVCNGVQVKHSEEDLLRARRTNTALKADKTKLDELLGALKLENEMIGRQVRAAGWGWLDCRWLRRCVDVCVRKHAGCTCSTQYPRRAAASLTACLLMTVRRCSTHAYQASHADPQHPAINHQHPAPPRIFPCLIHKSCKSAWRTDFHQHLIAATPTAATTQPCAIMCLTFKYLQIPSNTSKY